MSEISKGDWKKFVPLRNVALERFYAQSLVEVAKVSAKPDTHPADACVEIVRYLKEREKEARAVFDVERRSTAPWQLVAIQLRNLLTAEEMSVLSEELRTYVTETVESCRKSSTDGE